MTIEVSWKAKFKVWICQNCDTSIVVKEGLVVDVWCCNFPDLTFANINKTDTIWLDSEGDGYEVRKYVKALTYKPKIQKVLDGIIKQTIRPLGKQPIEKGDHILFHGWKDRPYHSDWSWRKEVIVSHVDQCEMFKQGIWFHEGAFFYWKHLGLTARKDGIERIGTASEGESMGILFNEMYDLPDADKERKGKDMEIIEWL